MHEYREEWPHLFHQSPASVTLFVRGAWRTFDRAVWQAAKPGIVLQYRERSCPASDHLYVYADGTWAIDHRDQANPDPPCNRPLEHLARDVEGGGVLLVAAAVLIGLVLLA
ncbi:MAG: hypothetical protein K8M05_25010 [Deltaproteobacteria bacterium]|nr:hypothetical protein [Kofleriaceae bacterium]